MILILGDGDFSYTLALLANNLFPSTNILATSYDSLQQLQKYPASATIMAKIAKCSRFKLKHQVNAVDLAGTLGTATKYEMVIWNHPHLGIEDYRLHRQLLAHFFHSCCHVLQENGIVRVVLLKGQETRWKLVEQATKFGFKLVKIQRFDESSLGGYSAKRNKNDLSFKNYATKIHTQSTMVSYEYEFEIGQGGLEIEFEDESGFDVSELLETVKELKLGNKSKEQRLNSVPSDLKCVDCGKQLISRWSYLQHYKTLHVLKKYEINECKCVACGRLFKDQEALWQHEINKHNELRLSTSTVGENLTNEYTCNICGGESPSESTHMKSFEPSQGTLTGCMNRECDKLFIEPRAMLQHYKFCIVAEKRSQLTWS